MRVKRDFGRGRKRKEGKESADVFFTRVNKSGTKSGLNIW